jgi:molybdopterin converting factor small subunit
VKIRVRVYQRLRHIVGTPEKIIDVESSHTPPTIAFVVTQLSSAHPQMSELLPTLRFAKNGEFATADTALSDGDTLDLMPPFSGG